MILKVQRGSGWVLIDNAREVEVGGVVRWPVNLITGRKGDQAEGLFHYFRAAPLECKSIGKGEVVASGRIVTYWIDGVIHTLVFDGVMYVMNDNGETIESVRGEPFTEVIACGLCAGAFLPSELREFDLDGGAWCGCVAEKVKPVLPDDHSDSLYAGKLG